ncbi:MAG: hypothetical protein RIR26_1349 [Pseudomonadota bacterium]
MRSSASLKWNFAYSLILIVFFALSFGSERISFARQNNGVQSIETFESKQPGLEFSISIPPQWIVEKNIAGYAAVLKPSARAVRRKVAGFVSADPTITIAAVKKPISFDSESLERGAKEIEERFLAANGSGTGFQIFQKNIVEDLPEGRKGLLYYVYYKADDAEVGQAILLTGNETSRYRVTLSDHRSNFDQNLEQYYPYMTSLQFSTHSTSQKKVFDQQIILIALGLLFGGFVIGLLVRKRGDNDSFDPERVMSRGSDDGSVPATYSNIGSEGPQRRPSEAEAPSFSPIDLSAPPQSIPLSQVVDENSAPPEMRKQWQMFTRRQKKNSR